MKTSLLVFLLLLDGKLLSPSLTPRPTSKCRFHSTWSSGSLLFLFPSHTRIHQILCIQKPVWHLHQTDTSSSPLMFSCLPDISTSPVGRHTDVLNKTLHPVDQTTSPHKSFQSHNRQHSSPTDSNPTEVSLFSNVPPNSAIYPWAAISSPICSPSKDVPLTSLFSISSPLLPPSSRIPSSLTWVTTKPIIL